MNLAMDLWYNKLFKFGINQRILKILSSISKKVCEPHLFIENLAWNSATSTDIIVTISSNYYENLAKSFFHICIKQSQVSILNRSTNMSISFTDSIEDLNEYFLDQVIQKFLRPIVSLCNFISFFRLKVLLSSGEFVDYTLPAIQLESAW